MRFVLRNLERVIYHSVVYLVSGVGFGKYSKASGTPGMFYGRY